MSRRISKFKWILVFSIGIMGALFESTWADAKHSPLLSSDTIVSLKKIKQSFPEITQTLSSGENLTATGRPTATRSIIYANKKGSKKITISVDQYKSSKEALLAYKEALKQSEAVSGFKLISRPKIGQQAFVGSVTQGKETHIGLGLLNKGFIVGVTLVGYKPEPANIANLIALAKIEDGMAQE